MVHPIQRAIAASIAGCRVRPATSPLATSSAKWRPYPTFSGDYRAAINSLEFKLIFLVTPNTRTISVLLYDLSEEGRIDTLTALGDILLVITMVFVGIGFKLVGRDFMLRRE